MAELNAKITLSFITMSADSSRPIRTAAQVADGALVDGLLSKKRCEDREAEKLMTQFKQDRGDEMKRVADEVIKPHMRAWAKRWFHSHGLDVSQLPETPAPEAGALVL